MQKDERKFEEVVHSIVQSEADVDRILDAAKLERHERPDNRLNAEQKFELIEFGIIAGLPVLLIAMFVFLLIFLR